MRILLVEDNGLLGSGLRLGLGQHGYTVDWLTDGRSALQALLAQNDIDYFDLVILDVGLPKIDGFEILEILRNKNIGTPVLMLTALDSYEEKTKGLDLGADDYLCKPFDLGELCARIRALLRRASGSSGFGDRNNGSNASGRANPVIKIADITLDPASRRVYRDKQLIELSRREFVVLHLLMENVNKALSREQILQNIYGWGDDVDSNALDVHIHNVRKKIGSNIISTVRGIGYMVEDISKLEKDLLENKD